MEQLANEWMRLAVTHAWQVTALIVLTAIVVRLFARNRPHLAFVLWLLVLVKCVTPPVWSSPSGVFSWLQPSRTVASADSRQQPDNVEDGKQRSVAQSTVSARFVPSPVPVRESRDLTPQPRDLKSESLVAVDMAGHSSPTASIGSIERIVIALLVTWLSGAALIVVVAVFRYLGFRWRLNRHNRVEESRLTNLVRDLSHRLKVKRKVHLRVSTGRVGPAVIGVLRPTVLLPSVLVKGRSDEELKPLLAHELIHVRRGDLWIGMLQVIAQALWWCHPLVWWAGRRTSREAERCCDEEVIAELGCSPARYARSLLGVLELKKTLKPVPAFPGVRPVEVTSNRLERIMKLGQGCRRRTPWWCWIVLVMAGAGMLPGAAFLAGEEEWPARDLTLPQGKHVASIPPLPKNVPEEPLVTCVYEVADLVEKARLELGLDAEAAKLAVKNHPGVLGGVAPVAESEGPDSRSKKKGPRAAWFEGKLIVHHTAARRDRISKTLAVLRKHGFGQVVIEARLVIGPEKIINAVGSNWTVMAAEVAPDEQPTHQDPGDPTRAFRYFIGVHGLPTPPLPDKATKQRARGQTVIEKRLPVMFEVMDDGRASEVIQNLQGDARVNMLAAPKVTTFNGQSAVISSCSQRPFVVGIKGGEPQIRIVDEGFTMQLRPIRRADARIWLDCTLTLSNIRDVETTTIPAGKGQTVTRLQVPVVAKTQLNMSVEALSGKTLVIGGLKTTDKKGKEQAMLVMLRPTALAPAVGDALSGHQMFGVGVNSDAGVTGTIAIDSENFAVDTPDAEAADKSSFYSLAGPIFEAHPCQGIEPPSDDEVIRAVGEKRKLNGTWVRVFEKNGKDIRIVKEKKADYVDPPRTYPLIGPAELHHTHYKCSVYFTESLRVGWPIPHTSEKEAVEVVYIETSHLHKLDAAQRKAATLEMHERLKQKVDVCFESTPLSEVLDEIGRKAELNIAIDEAGIHEEGVTVDEPVTIQLASAISVKSALNLILEPLHLDHMIVGEVLKVTSETRIAGRVSSRVYNVANLAVPIPDPDITLSPKGNWVAPPPSQDVAPDFDAIIELVTSTIAPNSWAKVGGAGAIEAFPTNLSLVVSQTEEVHEQIVGLLEQLRRLQDVQVTLSVKAIRVSDDRDHPNSAWAEFMGESTIRAAAADILRSVVSKGRRDNKPGAGKMTLFNGQKTSIRFPRLDSERMKCVGAFHFQPVASDDRRSVRLTFVVENLESPGEAREGTTKVVPVGESLVVDVTGHLDARQHNKPASTSGDKHPDPHSSSPHDAKINSGERLLVVLTPQIIVNEPEEAANSDIPGTVHR